ncbi:MAG: hypothetical protein AAFX54_17185 [Pseudomonadota bacterium]
MSAFRLFSAAFLILFTIAGSARAGDDLDQDACTFKGFPLYGDIQIVDSFPDIKVQIVESFPDLKVQIVDSFPDKCGLWRYVDSFPDVKIQYVESFPDIKIEMVTSFPGFD